MSDNTKIEWADASWNPITGCTPISVGCKNCYAAKMAHRFHRSFEPGTSNGLEKWGIPAKWKKPRRIFVCSTGDLFHEKVDAGYIQDVFRVVEACPRHTFMLLTKRPEAMKFYVNEFWKFKFAPSNLWAGVTAEDVHEWRKRVPILRDVKSAVHFVSVEPMLSHIFPVGLDGIDWVIAGAETGRGKRPMDPRWFNDLHAECASQGVPFFGKKDSNGKPLGPREFPR